MTLLPKPLAYQKLAQGLVSANNAIVMLEKHNEISLSTGEEWRKHLSIVSGAMMETQLDNREEKPAP